MSKAEMDGRDLPSVSLATGGARVLKPEITEDFAARVGHRSASDSSSRLDFAVYARSEDLTSKTAAELVGAQAAGRASTSKALFGCFGNYSEDSEQPTPMWI